jgi:hypothetical protein
LNDLYVELGGLIPSLPGKKLLASNLARADRLVLVDYDQPDLRLKAQCDLLGLNRSHL